MMTVELNATLKAMLFVSSLTLRLILAFFSWNIYLDCTVWYQWVAMRALSLSNMSLDLLCEPQIH